MAWDNIEENKRLVDTFPFLKPDSENYNYEYTNLDEMPDGWRKSFGEKLCTEIKETLTEEELESYGIIQIKEKFGGLRWYDFGGNKITRDIIHKYEDISYTTCIDCGEPARYISKGWISPYCGTCAQEYYNRRNKNESVNEKPKTIYEYFYDIDKYYKKEDN